MKVLHLNVHEVSGGAARAAYRIHQGLCRKGVDSSFLVQRKEGDDPSVAEVENRIGRSLDILRTQMDKLPLRLFAPSRAKQFSLSWFPGSVNGGVAQISPHLVHLHWVNYGFVSIGDLVRFRLPIVWTLHDMWAFTGGCFYAMECTRYEGRCGKCPQLDSARENDLSRWIWKRKSRLWKDLDLTIVTPSRWLGECASKSSLFSDRRIAVIPNGLDLDIFKPADKKFARETLGLPQAKKLILFGAMGATSDTRKGYKWLEEAMRNLSSKGWSKRAEVVVFGAERPESPPDFGFESHFLGKVSDDHSLVLAYSAADVFIAPSIQENLANTVVEGLSCGVPCVAFNIGGMPDMIEHGQNGYLAKPFDVEDLANGVAWVLDNTQQTFLAMKAREKAEKEYGLESVARKYLGLYNEIIRK